MRRKDGRFLRRMEAIASGLGMLALSGCVTAPRPVASMEEATRLFALPGSGQLLPPDFAELDEIELRIAIRAPIRFYARLVDPEGNPIAGAQVRAIALNEMLPVYEFPYVTWTELPERVSGPSGDFQITGAQGAVLFLRVAHADFWPPNEGLLAFRIADRFRHPEDPPLPERSRDRLDIVLEPRPLEAAVLQFDTGAVRLAEGAEEVDLAIHGVHPYGVPPGEGFLRVRLLPEGGVELAAPGGGLQLAGEVRPRMVPENGYREVLILSSAESLARVPARLIYLLYFRTAEGHFGTAMVSLNRTGRFVRAYGVLNPHGSRYVEVSTDQR